MESHLESQNSASNYLRFLQELIVAAGALSLEYRADLETLEVSSKNANVRDLVSNADKGIESYIRKQIAAEYPAHQFLGEESGASATCGPDDLRWVVDPIDGTVNFVKGGPHYNISIALQRGRGQSQNQDQSQEPETLCGAVFAPALGQLFWAEKDGGAFQAQLPLSPADCAASGQLLHQNLQPKSLAVRQLGALDEAVLITGFGCLRAGIQPDNYLYLGYILPHVSDIRRFGASALDICYVAAGIYDGFWEIGLNIYDLAAGCLILEEAGGTYSDLYGGMVDFPSSVLASNPILHKKILEILEPAEKPYNGFRSLLAARL